MIAPVPVAHLDRRAHLAWHLDQLGPTPRQVYKTLRRRHITGTRTLADACPVANYLRFVAGYRRVLVSPYDIVAFPTFGDCVGIRTPTPLAIRTFVIRFDDGRYRKLRA